MTTEIKMTGVACNLRCAYCYQNAMRDAGNLRPPAVDLDRMIAEARRAGPKFSLFGGEPLLARRDDVERMFQSGCTGLQTNGTLIDEEWIRLFVKYKAGIGVSIDGPGEMNDLRVAGTEDETRAATNRTMANIEAMRHAGVGVSVIITAHRLNGLRAQRYRLKDFIAELSRLGVSVNLHSLETESDEIKNRYALTQEEESELFVDLAIWLERNPMLCVQPFKDVQANLRGEDGNSLCCWHFCDPLTTQAVNAIESDGSLTNCSRMNKEGIVWLKAASSGYERYISLYHSPQNMGGCQGCRFFLLCGGGCPGEGQGQDWRNRTDHCHTIRALYQHYERRMLRLGQMPVSQSPERERMERALLDKFTRGQRSGLAGLKDCTTGHGDGYTDQHGDHTDMVRTHGDVAHGDIPHGDQHGDHTDKGA